MPILKVHNLGFRHDDLFELQLERGDVSFEPGACLALFNAEGDSRPYSISAGTQEKVLRFLIRRVQNGRVSEWLEASGIDYTHIHREIFFYEDGQD